MFARNGLGTNYNEDSRTFFCEVSKFDEYVTRHVASPVPPATTTQEEGCGRTHRLGAIDKLVVGHGGLSSRGSVFAGV